MGPERKVAEVNSQPFGENVLLRLNKAIYKAGDTLAISKARMYSQALAQLRDTTSPLE